MSENKNEAPELELVEKTEAAAAEDEVGKHVVVFKKPYKFEGKAYTRVDLSRLEEITAEDLAKAEKLAAGENVVAVQQELTLNYCMFVAQIVTQRPMEFFKRLPAHEAIRVKYVVLNFLMDMA